MLSTLALQPCLLIEGLKSVPGRVACPVVPVQPVCGGWPSHLCGLPMECEPIVSAAIDSIAARLAIIAHEIHSTALELPLSQQARPTAPCFAPLRPGRAVLCYRTNRPVLG